MNKFAKLLVTAVVISTFPVIFGISSAHAQQWPGQADCQNGDNGSRLSEIQQGWCLAINQNKGNCIACHTFNISPWPADLPLPGNIAPPLAAMQPRFPDSAVLRGVLEDATAFNSNTLMPPYAKHRILDQLEIDLILKFLESI